MTPNLKLTLSELNDDVPIVFTIADKYIGLRTDVALAEIITDLSRSKLTNWLKEGCILINQKIAKAKDKIHGGEEIFINPPFTTEANTFLAENIDLNIIYQDEHVLVLNKPVGLVVHPGAGNQSGTLLNALLFHYPELNNIPRAGIVHRLDKDTSGLMVIAKTLLAQLSLVDQLQKRQVKRIYRALVEGYPFKEGIVDKNIGRDPHNRIKMTALDFGGKPAITHYRLLKQFDKIAYIECKLETGRTHQIRVHMKNIGLPLIGDPLYGSRKINYPIEVVEAVNNLNRQALHALKLSFTHPFTKKWLEFKTKLPDDMRNLIAALTLDEDLLIDDNSDDDKWEIIYAYDKE